MSELSSQIRDHNSNNMDNQNRTELHQLMQENKDLLTEIEHLRHTVDRKEAHIKKLKSENKLIKDQIKKISNSLQQVCLNHDEDSHSESSCSCCSSQPQQALAIAVSSRKRPSEPSPFQLQSALPIPMIPRGTIINEVITISDDEEQSSYPSSNKRSRIVEDINDSQLIYSQVVPETSEEEDDPPLEISPSLLAKPDEDVGGDEPNNCILICNEIRKQGTPKNFLKFIPQILVQDQNSRISLLELSHVSLELKILFGYLESCSEHIKSLNIFNFKILDKIPENKVILPNLESFSLRGGENIISILLMDFGTVNNRIDSFINRKVVDKLIFFKKDAAGGSNSSLLELNTHIILGNLEEVLLEINPNDGKISSKLDCTAELLKNTGATTTLWKQIHFTSINFNWNEVRTNIENSWWNNLKVLNLEDEYNFCEVFKATSSPESSEELYGRNYKNVGQYISPHKNLSKLKNLNALWLKYKADNFFASVPLSMSNLVPNPMLKVINLSNITVHLDFFPKSTSTPSFNLDSFGFDKCKFKGTSFSKYLSVFNPKNISLRVPNIVTKHPIPGNCREKYFERIRGIFNYSKMEGSSLERVKLAGFNGPAELNNVLENYIGGIGTTLITSSQSTVISMKKNSSDNVWSFVPNSFLGKDMDTDINVTKEFFEWNY